ncbi:uncharacterized protein FTJAE_10071 [Fusarium tjaetaba]|uniref:Alpha/beta hydrolase fold-3 domain-containing protein n=1 Tax=Fusarium tjaetaba TaxID=1567544 RepID=A0A8H5VLC8_9HYPO|nr:uncharacterized protein FTJAE_10071 [Fusarium tjaetaba]KAF5625174.1 hypothetical protein FTJAE_10071 [Fusarium tjaetaba]
MDVTEYVYNTVDGGVPLKADVYYKSVTDDAVREAGPIVLVIYGGGFVNGSKAAVSKARLESLVHDFGFTVVVPDYRHCPTVSVFQGPVADIHASFSWTCKELPALLSRDAGVAVDGGRVAVIGSSAGGTLALHLASATPPPKAIVSYFPAMYLKDPFWHSPMEVFSQIPRFPQSFLDQVHSEGIVTATPSAFKKVPDSPKPVPDFSMPRTAYLLSNLRDGTLFRNVVQDGDYERVDPVELFSAKFPPTCFVHGSEDKMCLPKFSQKAHESLVSLGVDTELLIADGEGHDFESSMSKDHPRFSIVHSSHQFIADRV